MTSMIDGLGGEHLLWTFLASIGAGFLAVYIDAYLVSKIESAVGITPTAY